MKNLLEIIKEKANNLPPKQFELAKYIVNNYQSLAYANVIELSQLSSVSEATIIRLAYSLGFKGFHDMQQKIRELIGETNGGGLVQYKPRSLKDLKDCSYCLIFEMEKRILEETFLSIEKDNFESAVNMICEAPAVVVVGTEFNECLSSYAGYYLHVIKEKVTIISDFGINEKHILQELPPGTLGIVFSTPRYPRKTQKVVDILYQKEIPIIGITDSLLSPIAPFVNNLFTVPQQFVTFMDPYAAIMAFTHSLLLGVFMKNPEKSRKRVKQFDSFLKSEGIHLKDKIDISNLV